MAFGHRHRHCFRFSRLFRACSFPATMILIVVRSERLASSGNPQVVLGMGACWAVGVHTVLEIRQRGLEGGEVVVWARTRTTTRRAVGSGLNWDKQTLSKDGGVRLRHHIRRSGRRIRLPVDQHLLFGGTVWLKPRVDVFGTSAELPAMHALPVSFRKGIHIGERKRRGTGVVVCKIATLYSQRVISNCIRSPLLT